MMAKADRHQDESRTMRRWRLVGALRSFSMRKLLAPIISCALLAGAALSAPPASTHPILGTWQFTLPGGECSETYYFRRDGTYQVTSGEQISESEYEITAKPNAKGFYEVVDTIVKDNGKKDCLGQVMEVGHKATNFIFIHPGGQSLIVCKSEAMSTCFGPVRRLAGQKS